MTGRVDREIRFRVRSLALIALIVFILTGCAAKTVYKWDMPAERNEHIEIDLWSWGARAAVSFTCDEGVAEPYRILMPEVERRGWRMTFFVHTDQLYAEDTWDIVVDAHERGHEVSSHTVSHPDLTTLAAESIARELEGGIEELQERLGWDLPLQSFAYPYEATNSEVQEVVRQYHRYSRAGDHGVPVPPNPVPLNDAHAPDWGALKAKANTQSVTLEHWNAWVDEAVAQGKWLIEEYHGVCEGTLCGGWEPRTIEEFRAHFDRIEAHGADVWVAPMRHVGHYIDERETAYFVVKEWSSKEVALVFIDRWTEPYFNVPLTYVIEVPDEWGWEHVIVMQEGEEQRVEKLGPNRFRTSSVPDPEKVIYINEKM